MRYRVEYMWDDPHWRGWHLKAAFPELHEAHKYSHQCETRFPARFWRIRDIQKPDIPARFVRPKGGG